MRPMALLAIPLLVALALGGCMKDPLAPTPDVEVAGKPDPGYRSNTALKIPVTAKDGKVTTVAFDRGEWYVAGLEREITSKGLRYVAVVGEEKATKVEVLVREFKAPANYTERFRYDHLRDTHTETELLAMDREWDDLLARSSDAPGPAVDVNATAPLPALSNETAPRGP